MNDISPAKSELIKAQRAREAGNEGMARVCARRASGFAIREYFENNGNENLTIPLNKLFKDEEIRSVLPVSLTSSLDHLTVRVDMPFTIPQDIDLIADACKIIEVLSHQDGRKSG